MLGLPEQEKYGPGGGATVPAPVASVPQAGGVQFAGRSSLVPVRSNEQIDADARAVEAQNTAPVDPLPRLTGHILRCWQEAQTARQDVELDLLRDLRQRNGEYEAEDKAKILAQGQPDYFDNVTETQCWGAESWIKDLLLFQPDERPWGLSPSPIPTLPEPVIAAIVSRAVQAAVQLQAETGQPITAQDIFDIAQGIRAGVDKRLGDIAREKAEAMEKKIADQFSEGGFDQAFATCIAYFCTFKAAVMKGPVVRAEDALSWTNGQDGQATPQLAPKIRYTYFAVNPLDFYMQPGAVNPNDGYVCEKVQFSVSTLEALKNAPYYSAANIDKVLSSYAAKGVRLMTNIDAARRELENRQQTPDSEALIEGIEWWGDVLGDELNDWMRDAMPGAMPDAEMYEATTLYHVRGILIDKYLIHAVVNPDPLGEKPYYVTSYRKVPGTPWGKSIPQLARHKQRFVNSVARAIVQNCLMASNAQSEVDIARLAPGEDQTSQYPGRLWQVNDKGQNYSQPAVRYFQPALTAPALWQIRQQAVHELQLETGVPPYAFGSDKTAGAGSTLGGLNILMGGASKGIKAAIYNLDMDILKQLVRKQWLYNMLYDKDESIKGDVDVVPKGAMTLFVREQIGLRQQALLATCASEPFVGLLGPVRLNKMLRKQFSNAQVDPRGIVPEDEELQQELAQQQAAAMEQQAMQMQVAAAQGSRNGNPNKENGK